MEREVAAYKVLSSLAIVNYYENIPQCYERPTCKSYVSPYAKFDKIRRKRK